MKQSIALTSLRVLGFLATLCVWLVVEAARVSQEMSLLIVFSGSVLVAPAACLARKAVDRKPAIQHVHWITSVLHIVIMVLLGSSTIEAIKLFQVLRVIRVPIPVEFAIPLLLFTGFCTFLSVANLALSGLGAPFAIALSRRIADRWMYRWTRNPMVLATSAMLVSGGLFLQSLSFLLWVILIFAPVLLYYVKTYEERELEIRFGATYLDYKSKTSFLWPRKPRG